MVHAYEALGYIYPTLFLKVDEREQMLAYVTEVGLAVHCQTHEVKSIE